jgi:hypothetical protein
VSSIIGQREYYWFGFGTFGGGGGMLKVSFLVNFLDLWIKETEFEFN